MWRRRCVNGDWTAPTLHAERDQPVELKADPLTTTDMVACLVCLRKSAQFWEKPGGRQGYLNYIINFTP